MATGSAVGTVPKSVHHISAAEAQQLLQMKGFNGSFLVRTSTNDPKAYAISYRVLNKVVHVKCESTAAGFTARNLPDEYPTIDALITDVQRKKPGLDYQLWPPDGAPESFPPTPNFIHHISGTEAAQLLLTKGFNGSFLVRTSASDPKAYAISYRVLNNISHMKFGTTEEGFADKSLADEYPTNGALISEVQSMRSGLDYPLWPSDPAPEGIPPRLFFGRLSSKHAERLLLDPDAQPDRNVLVRSSTTYADRIVLSVRLATRAVTHYLTERRGGKFFVKSLDKEISCDTFRQLLNYFIGRRAALAREDKTVIHLMKPMICPWNNDPCGAKGKMSALPSKPAMKSHLDVTEKFHEPTSPVYCNVGDKCTGNVYENNLLHDQNFAND